MAQTGHLDALARGVRVGARRGLAGARAVVGHGEDGPGDAGVPVLGLNRRGAGALEGGGQVVGVRGEQELDGHFLLHQVIYSWWSSKNL